MAQLPFLVEHGDLVWKVLAVLAAGASIAWVRRTQARGERRATERELAARAAATTAPVEGVATVRGMLRGGSARSVSLLHLRGRRPYYDERAAELWVECAGERVTLIGPVRVVRGTRLVSTRDRRSGLADGERSVRSSPILHRLTAMTASVRDGDAVFVTARLAARPAADAMGYREAATAWTAVPHGAAIEVVAAQPAVRAVPPGSTSTLVSGLAGAWAAVAVLWTLGTAALSWTGASQTRTSERETVALGELDTASLAAATPGHRGAALAWVEARLAARAVRTADSFALWRAVARERGGCGAEIRARIAQDDIDGLAPLAKHCSDDAAAVEAYQLLGMFREAVARSKDVPSLQLPVEAMIAMRVWGRASEWAVAQRDAALARGAANASRARAFDCAAEWWSRLDDGHVDASMARARYTQSEPACGVFAALSLREPERRHALAAVAVPRERIQQIANLLAWAEGAPPTSRGVMPSPADLHAAVFEAGDRMTVARALLAEPAYAEVSLSQDAPVVMTTLAWRTVHAALSEDIGLARARAREVTEFSPVRPSPPVDRDERVSADHGRGLQAAVALRFRTRLPRVSSADDPRDDEVLWDRIRTTYWGPRIDRDACNPQLGDALLRAAHDGDGHDLAALLARCRVGGADLLEAVFAVWPRVRQGRGELAEVLRRLDLGATPADPLAVIGRAALRRDLARMIGDDRAADAWEAVVNRHVTAFAQPTQAAALISRELVRDAER